MIKERSEQEWQEFFESDDFDYTAFVPTNKQKKEQNKNSQMNNKENQSESKEKEKEKLIEQYD